MSRLVRDAGGIFDDLSMFIGDGEVSALSAYFAGFVRMDFFVVNVEVITYMKAS